MTIGLFIEIIKIGFSIIIAIVILIFIAIFFFIRFSEKEKEKEISIKIEREIEIERQIEERKIAIIRAQAKEQVLIDRIYQEEYDKENYMRDFMHNY